MSLLAEGISSSLRQFRTVAQESIQPGVRTVPTPSGKGDVEVTKGKINTALNLLCPRDPKIAKHAFLQHFRDLRAFIPFCSSPTAFRTAWDLRSEILNPYDADAIVSQGGQLIPLNSEVRVFQCIQQGVELGPRKMLVFAVRHSEGNYDDLLDDLGRFTYQPPKDVTGMLRYRLCQFLSRELRIPYPILAVMWFNYRLNAKVNQVFVIAPARILEPQLDLTDLNDSIHHPLHLQTITRDEAYSTLNVLFALDESDAEIETRYELPDRLAREWSFDKINASSKGKSIKRWAAATGKKCPGCGREFVDFPLAHISFGHILSQKWSNAFTFLLDKRDHPDNIYLTCRSCNSRLSENFPNRELRDTIVSIGTIGDWLRTNEKDIRTA